MAATISICTFKTASGDPFFYDRKVLKNLKFVVSVSAIWRTLHGTVKCVRIKLKYFTVRGKLLMMKNDQAGLRHHRRPPC